VSSSVADLTTLVAILEGPDGIDAGCTALPAGDPAGVPLHGLRVAVEIDNGIVRPGHGHDRNSPRRR
jgi:hypothetical protein